MSYKYESLSVYRGDETMSHVCKSRWQNKMNIIRKNKMGKWMINKWACTIQQRLINPHSLKKDVLSDNEVEFIDPSSF